MIAHRVQLWHEDKTQPEEERDTARGVADSSWKASGGSGGADNQQQDVGSAALRGHRESVILLGQSGSEWSPVRHQTA
ncbi:hypothetical protein AAFF_G00311470 [Aldrovandia affinis]|uniref:Uncharacterized protein n=1 Tax=Aldrovandia affinis TaxID=143900 RepID=A0AAD7R7R0_9TELE|nr:hypothetical protein AAFF_G00311470 [Aldrovandia affinis]